MIKAKLIVVGGDAKRSEVNLKKLPATIGRANEASITLPHALVSRQHCEIYESNNQLFVKDLNSLNGTYLNNQKIQGSVSLLPGQLLTLGNVTFRADYSLDDVTIQSDFPANNSPSLASNDAASAEPDREAASGDDTDHGGSAPGSDTDKHVFALDDQTPKPLGKSIAFDALAKLPLQQPQASFKGNLQLEESPIANHGDEGVKIDLGEPSPTSRDASQSSLDEFLRKLPK